MVSDAASCQTSALMKRNVTKTSSSGSARVIIGSSERRLPKVRPSAQVTIGPARSTVRAYAAAPAAPSDSRTAGAVLTCPVAQASTTAAAPESSTTSSASGRSRRGRRPSRTRLRTSGTK